MTGGAGGARAASHDVPYGFGVRLPIGHAAAIERAREALAAEGFGVLSEIDVAATLERKLGVRRPPYVILGACNPPLAHRALELEPDIGLLLPCNVVVYATDEDAAAPRTAVVALDPEAALGVTGRADIAPVAAEVKARLRRVVDRLTTPPSPA